MKKILTLLVLMLILVSATEFDKKDTPIVHPSIEGTWELVNFYNYDDEIVSDTVPLAEGYRQIKMFYNSKIMWSRTTLNSTKDPDGNNVVGRFGYGTYTTSDTGLVETIEYGDAGMMSALGTMRVFTFELDLTNDSYSQISTDEEGNRTFSENYKRID